MPDFLWCVRVVEVAGVAADAMAKAPARKRQKTEANCLTAGLCCIESCIGPRIKHFSRLSISLRKGRRGTQLLRRTAFLPSTAGRRDRCWRRQHKDTLREAATGRPAPHSYDETAGIAASGLSDSAKKRWQRPLSAAAWP